MKSKRNEVKIQLMKKMLEVWPDISYACARAMLVDMIKDLDHVSIGLKEVLEQDKYFTNEDPETYIK